MKFTQLAAGFAGALLIGGAAQAQESRDVIGDIIQASNTAGAKVANGFDPIGDILDASQSKSFLTKAIASATLAEGQDPIGDIIRQSVANAGNTNAKADAGTTASNTVAFKCPPTGTEGAKQMPLSYVPYCPVF